MTDKTHNIQESADKIVIKTKLTRGGGTRDQDKIDVKVKGNDSAEVVEKLNNTLELLSETAQDARDINRIMRCPYCNKLIIHKFNGNYNRMDKKRKQRHMRTCDENPDNNDNL